MRTSETSPVFERLYAVCSALFVTGLYLDGWAHNHLASSLETFFTPWHAVFYSGYLLTTMSLLWWMVSRRRRFGSYIDAVPPGHGLSLAGALLFVLGGFADFGWHEVFGIEADVEALLSPTHLILAVGMTLMIGGGARHFWATRKPGVRRGFFECLPFLLSAGLTASIILFMTQYGRFTQIEAAGLAPPDPFYPQAVSVLGSLVFTGVMVGSLTMLLRRDRLPFGSVTFLLALAVGGVSLMRSGNETIPAALFAGILSDLWLEVAETRVKRITGLRVLCFLVPFVYYVLVFTLLPMAEGKLWWAVHLTAGLPVVAGVTGLLMSFVAWPPKQAVERTGWLWYHGPHD